MFSSQKTSHGTKTVDIWGKNQIVQLSKCWVCSVRRPTNLCKNRLSCHHLTNTCELTSCGPHCVLHLFLDLTHKNYLRSILHLHVILISFIWNTSWLGHCQSITYWVTFWTTVPFLILFIVNPSSSWPVHSHCICPQFCHQSPAITHQATVFLLPVRSITMSALHDTVAVKIW